MKSFPRFTISALLCIVLLSVTVAAAAAPAPEQPNITFTLVQGLPGTMQVGESYTVEILVTSDTPFLFSTALPSAYFPGRYVTAAAGDHSGAGTSATLFVTFTAKGSTSVLPNGPRNPGLPNGAAPVSVIAGARFQGGYVATQSFDFFVVVP